LKLGFRKLLGLESKSSLATPDDFYFDLFAATPAASGIRVTPKTAMTCAPVRAAVHAISEAIGQLPVHVYHRKGDSVKERAPDHPAYKLLHDEANEWTPAAKFREEITRDALLQPGGGFAIITRVEGKPVELHRIDPEVSKVSVEADDWGAPIYKVQTGKGNPVTVARENMLHLPSPALSGQGLVYEAREAIGLALIMERYAARLFGNGARPSGLLSVPKLTTADNLTKIKAAWNAAHGDGNSGGTAILPEDSKWNQITLNSVDAQFLELRTFTVDEISRVFRVPPMMIFEYGRATWGNAEQQGQSFLTYSIMPWVKRWEGEIRLKLLTPDERAAYFAEFLTDDLARADLAARSAAYTNGIM
jgi:HK97 family phage portal protein